MRTIIRWSVTFWVLSAPAHTSTGTGTGVGTMVGTGAGAGNRYRYRSGVEPVLPFFLVVSERQTKTTTKSTKPPGLLLWTTKSLPTHGASAACEYSCTVRCARCGSGAADEHDAGAEPPDPRTDHAASAQCTRCINSKADCGWVSRVAAAAPNSSATDSR